MKKAAIFENDIRAAKSLFHLPLTEISRVNLLAAVVRPPVHIETSRQIFFGQSLWMFEQSFEVIGLSIGADIPKVD